MQAEDIFTQITRVYNQLTRSEVLLADYVMKNKYQVQNATVAYLANACGISIATVTRFCRSVGCGSFNEFKLRVAQAAFADGNNPTDDEIDLYGEIAPEDPLDMKCQKLYNISKEALSQTLSHLDTARISEAVALLCEARNVFCFGQGNSSIVAMDAWGRFASVSSKFHWVPDAHLQADTAAILAEKDVILYFSFSGSTRELAEVGELSRGTKAKLILVTRFPNSPGAAYADLLLLCAANESPRQQGSIAAKISQLFIIDILYNEYCAHFPQLTQENRDRSLAATTKMMVQK